MTRQAAHERDWPLPAEVWEVLVWLVLIAVLSMIARQAMGAERGRRAAVRPALGPAAAALVTRGASPSGAR